MSGQGEDASRERGTEAEDEMPQDGNPAEGSAGDPGSEGSSTSPANAARAGFPGLVLVATPIGNLGDLSPRAVAALRDADSVLCEDTRTSGPMLARQGIKTPLVPLHDHNEGAVADRLVERMARGERLALISDAGTPLMSDPGFRLARAAIEAGVTISAVPGPNAAVMALTLSGLPPHPFLFHGFLPTKAAARTAELGRIRAMEQAGLHATLIFYEAPHRLAEALLALADTLGADRPAAVARELTKRFEEVRRASLGALAAHYAAEAARGEIVVVVGPAPDEAAPAEDALDAQLQRALDGGASLRDAAAMVAAATGLPRRQVYNRALQLGSTA